MVILRYRGIDSQGNGRSGRIEAQSPYAFVHAAFSMGWRELSVYVEGRDGIVGEIGAEPDGRRTWWGKP